MFENYIMVVKFHKGVTRKDIDIKLLVKHSLLRAKTNSLTFLLFFICALEFESLIRWSQEIVTLKIAAVNWKLEEKCTDKSCWSKVKKIIKKWPKNKKVVI